ncbi:hypothetical protein [Cetobacterium sp.]|uniref:hypothetical protein n=1 Tax=Cetobacterium sp. TaxID=2071632 RepID=UPI003F3BC168
MESKKYIKKIEFIEKLLSENKLKEAQIEIEELQKRMRMIDMLNTTWGSWRTNFVQKNEDDLKSEFRQLKEIKIIVLNENFEKNVNDLKEYDAEMKKS